MHWPNALYRFRYICCNSYCSYQNRPYCHRGWDKNRCRFNGTFGGGQPAFGSMVILSVLASIASYRYPISSRRSNQRESRLLAFVPLITVKCARIKGNDIVIANGGIGSRLGTGRSLMVGVSCTMLSHPFTAVSVSLYKPLAE